jgi:hypothetical protein
MPFINNKAQSVLVELFFFIFFLIMETYDVGTFGY